MKVKSLVLSAAAAIIVPVAGLAGAVSADSPGQIGGGDIYSVKNLTQNTKYSNSTTANACDEVQYSVRLHNPTFSGVKNIVVKASLPAGASTSNTSQMIITYTDGVASPVSDTAVVNLTSAQSISYESGSAVLYGTGGQVIRALPDGIVNGAGVNVGSLSGSTTEYVNFKAKVSCPTPPTCKTNCTPQPPVTPPSTPNTPSTPAQPGQPTTLVNTGPGSDVAVFLAATLVGMLGYRKYLSRRLSRQ